MIRFNVPPLAIVQARMGSKRLPGKMLKDLGGKPLIDWAWEAAWRAFGTGNVVIATTAARKNRPLIEYLESQPGREVFVWDGDEDDVLGRFYHCANMYRWHPDSIIVRVTPDDPFKDPASLQAVVQGYRLPVEIGGEAFTLGHLNQRHDDCGDSGPLYREHITNALFDVPPPPPPEGVWTVDTKADLEAARRLVGGSLQTEN